MKSFDEKLNKCKEIVENQTWEEVRKEIMADNMEVAKERLTDKFFLELNADRPSKYEFANYLHNDIKEEMQTKFEFFALLYGNIDGSFNNFLIKNASEFGFNTIEVGEETKIKEFLDGNNYENEKFYNNSLLIFFTDLRGQFEDEISDLIDENYDPENKEKFLEVADKIINERNKELLELKQEVYYEVYSSWRTQTENSIRKGLDLELSYSEAFEEIEDYISRNKLPIEYDDLEYLENRYNKEHNIKTTTDEYKEQLLDEYYSLNKNVDKNKDISVHLEDIDSDDLEYEVRKEIEDY